MRTYGYHIVQQPSHYQQPHQYQPHNVYQPYQPYHQPQPAYPGQAHPVHPVTEAPAGKCNFYDMVTRDMLYHKI